MHSEDLVIIQTISLIAREHDCIVTNVDISYDADANQRIGLIEIDGPEEKQYQLSVAINEALKKLEPKP